jgi:serine/threonine protein kinase/Flp pilus assembly protein TadD
MLEQVGRYKIERELGRGGMGVVYLAEDPMLGRKVAIKTVHFEITDPTQRDYLRTQLLRDARASAGLSHPNVVNVHDIIESGDTTYLVMEYIAGETLAARMQRPPAPDTAWLLRVLRDIAAALDYTHRKGVVHRDVKPGNIMMDSHQRVRIMDFGLARATEHVGGSTGMVAGTIQYMSPEQIRGDAIDGRADQFSMAAVAYEMLTGKALFEARTPITLAQKIVNEIPALAHVQNPALPEATSAVLARALDRVPSNRYPTCTAFVEALIGTFDGATVQALLRPPEEQPTIALTGMIDVDPLTKRSTAPVQRPGRLSAYAPLLIGVGLVTGAIGVTAVTLINGHSRGEAPTHAEVKYGPPPIIGPGPEGLPHKPVKIQKKAQAMDPAVAEKLAREIRPPEPPPTGRPPQPGDEPFDMRSGSRREMRGRGMRKDEGREIPGSFFQMPDFSKEMKGPESNLLQQGRKQMAARNFGIAAELFSAAIQVAPDDFHAYYYRGAARLGGGSPREAQADYEKVVAMRPDYAQGWYQLGVAMEHQHHFKEALESYARATTLKPELADAFYAAAMIYDQQSNPKKALGQLDKAIEANPRYGRAYQARAEIKKKMGDPSANADQQKARELGHKGPPGIPPGVPAVPIPVIPVPKVPVPVR